MISLEHLQLIALVVALLVSPAAAAGGAYAAIRWRLINLDRRCDELRDDVGRAHTRIDQVVSTP